MNGSELRRNPVNGKLALVAPGRASRPAGHERRAGGEAAPVCPFCAGREHLTPPEVDAVRPAGGASNGPGWRVRVVPNKYPAVPGGHEVILHSPDHDTELEDLGDDVLTEVLEMWRRRIAAQLARGAAAATLIVNRGAGSGASLEHPHEQLLATNVVPPLLLDELLEFERYRNRHGGCVLCAEMNTAGDRLVLDGPIEAWVPAASRFNGELWLAPREHEADLETADLPALAAALRRVLVALTSVTDDAPLNFWLHTAPADLRGPFHWHLEFAPRTAAIAGFELGSDIGVVTSDPVAAAAAYRAALPRD
jgi:UDPglucose--hexose-1-phosphate uridylyltransferase